MGWSSGSQLAEDVWADVKKYIPKEHRKKVARKLIDQFESHDADDWMGGKNSLLSVGYPERLNEDGE